MYTIFTIFFSLITHFTSVLFSLFVVAHYVCFVFYNINNVRKSNPLLEHHKPARQNSKSAAGHFQNPIQARQHRLIQNVTKKTSLSRHKSYGHSPLLSPQRP